MIDELGSTRNYDFAADTPHSHSIMPGGFEVVVTFEGLTANRTLLTKRSTFPSVDARNAVAKFSAVELGMQAIEKLAAFVRG